jgi:hypothetical protein
MAVNDSVGRYYLWSVLRELSRMQPKNIYLVFSKTGTWLSRLICLVSRIKYAHSSLSFDPGFTEMYSFGRTNPDNPFSGGFVVENLYEGVYKKFPRCECVIYKVAVTDEQYSALRKQIEQFLRNKEKYRYNFIGLFCVLLNKPLKRKYHYFCSQFVAEVLINSHILSSEKKPELITSRDLQSYMKDKDLIYEGFTKETRTVLKTKDKLVIPDPSRVKEKTLTYFTT